MYEFDDDDVDSGADYEDDWVRASDAHEHCAQCVAEGYAECCECGSMIGTPLAAGTGTEEPSK